MNIEVKKGLVFSIKEDKTEIMINISGLEKSKWASGSHYLTLEEANHLYSELKKRLEDPYASFIFG